MIPEIVLTHAKTRTINVHASLLPKYRGGSPMHRAIQNGDSVTGVSIMFMAMKMDSGDVLSQRVIPIAEDDNVGKIEEKLGLKSKKDIEEIGIGKFTQACANYVGEISDEWEWYVDRIGRWVDFKNSYRTMDTDYMESVLWVF